MPGQNSASAYTFRRFLRCRPCERGYNRASMSFLEIERIRKRFGDNVVLDGIDAAVSEGETLVLLGPSGSGKTTLLRILAGFETPASGQRLAHRGPASPSSEAMIAVSSRVSEERSAGGRSSPAT